MDVPDVVQFIDEKTWQELKTKLTGKFNRMMKALFHQKGAQLDIGILASDEAQDFINSHAGVLDSSFEQVKMTPKMRERLTRSNYIFSGIKAFHEMNEAFPSLVDENTGERKPFERFLNDVRKIDEKYNAGYLHSEYNFVAASATMAAKWEQFAEDGDRYYLQYRTAHDDKVRPEHAALDGVTLPMSDPFWETYYPPNGWNCRCTVVQVRKEKYPATDRSEAMERGEEAMGGEKYNIFRFNSGKQGKAVPDYNPYTIKRCNDCDIAKGKLPLAFVPEGDLCASCILVRKCYRNTSVKEERKRIAQNEKLFDKLSKDKRYKDVQFDSTTGALFARHVGHNVGENEGMNLEKKLAEELYRCGHSVILCDEQKKDKKRKTMVSLDMILDGVRMDIASITKNLPFYGNVLRRKNRQLVKYNARTDVHDVSDTVCLYFDNPSMFGSKKIKKGYAFMKKNTDKEVAIRHIICAIRSSKGLEIQTFDF